MRTDAISAYGGGICCPLIPAGPGALDAREALPAPTRPVQRHLGGWALARPHEALMLGIPLRMPACYVTGAWTTLDAFYVEDRFLGVTHWVPIELPAGLLMQEPASPEVPAKDLTCQK